MPKPTTVAAVIAGGLAPAVIAGALVLWSYSPRAVSRPTSQLDAEPNPTLTASEPDIQPAGEPEPAPAAAKPVPTLALVRATSEPVSVQRDPSELIDEASVLSRLHELAATDPSQSLRLARQAVNRFPDGPNAPELQWNVVKALFNMARLDEAKNEARVMLWKYPNSSFTGDVIHHLLNPPPNPPVP